MPYQNTPFTGRYCAFTVGQTTIRGVGAWTLAINFDEIDASDFTTTWKKNLTGSQGWSGTVEGYFDGATDSTGMTMSVLKGALQGTKYQDVRFYLNTATSYFFMPQFVGNWMSTGSTTSTDAGCYFSNAEIGATKGGLVSARFNVLGYGPIALFGSSTYQLVMEGT